MVARKIILDTDPGIDDAMALLFAAQSPAIDVLGITTILGNASLAITTRNALYIVERFDIPAPVFRGAAKPLVVAAGDAPDFVHGSDGLGNIGPAAPTREVSSLSAAEFIADTVMRYPGEVTLVAVGRLTNLALALAIDPEIADHVAEVVIMGGAFGVDGHGGNITPHAEANVYGDPHAANAVFGARWPIVMVGLDVTMQVVMRDAQMQRLRDDGGDIGAFIYEISRFYASFYASRDAALGGFPVHDSSALAYVIDPTLFTTRAGPVRAITEGGQIGRTIQTTDEAVLPAQRVCIGVEANRLLALFESTLCAG